MQNSRNDEPGRRSLPHDPPAFIETSDAIFFVTICCVPKGTNQLCKIEIAKPVFDSIRSYYDQHRWAVPLIVLMPDHLHMLVRFDSEADMKKIVRNWKRYSATQIGIRWQRDFFDHRLRTDETFAETADYIQQNPVRAGLVQLGQDWPYQMRLD
jgi:putative transposase